ncbi:hypothetical protein FACS1894109_02610 [Spirochaetia bacterium]|nr:hypothetical protein FACS1894109_02610 [Spirochaetia bacterium]
MNFDRILKEFKTYEQQVLTEIDVAITYIDEISVKLKTIYTQAKKLKETSYNPTDFDRSVLRAKAEIDSYFNTIKEAADKLALFHPGTNGFEPRLVETLRISIEHLNNSFESVKEAKTLIDSLNPTDNFATAKQVAKLSYFQAQDIANILNNAIRRHTTTTPDIQFDFVKVLN